ncbi:MAG: hypothetical protein WCT05_03345 [Lentisphaeria bacterium]
MLELSNVRHGAVLNHHDGKETSNGLEFFLEGLAPSTAHVKVNGKEAVRCGRNFKALVTLTSKNNEIVVSSNDKFGEAQQKIQVVWDKKSFPRYNFFIDDNIFFLTDIARQKPASLFDHFYLKSLRETNQRYGTKFTLNLFYHNDHDDFSLNNFPANYKGEFQENSDWLRLSFHAYSEFPDRPYQHATAEKIAQDYDLLYSEVVRFAGEETFIHPVVIHWGMMQPDHLSVLTKRGCRVMSGSFINSKTYVGEQDTCEAVCDIGYYQDADTASYLCAKHRLFDFDHGLCWEKDALCCNLLNKEEIKNKLNTLVKPGYTADTINLASHEQYSFPYYFNYLPDHLERIDLAAQWVTENGFVPVFYSHGFLGNTAWES